jgi:hypothetical protein
MKQRKLCFTVVALLTGLGLQPSLGWATRAVGATITGQITATPSAVQIEVAHHVYHIKPNSPAAKAFRNFYSGQTVDVFLDRPASPAEPTVVSIVKHAGS